MNLRQEIARRQRSIGRHNSVGAFAAGAVCAAAIVIAVMVMNAVFDMAFMVTCVLLILSIATALVNRKSRHAAEKRDELIVREIKRRLERALLELFKLECAGQTVSIEGFLDWRDAYFAECEHLYSLTEATQLWINTAESGNLPKAGYRQAHGDNAVFVEMAMQTILADS